MASEKTNLNPDDDQGRSSLKKALIILAIVEALVLIPTIIHLIGR